MVYFFVIVSLYLHMSQKSKYNFQLSIMVLFSELSGKR